MSIRQLVLHANTKDHFHLRPRNSIFRNPNIIDRAWGVASHKDHVVALAVAVYIEGRQGVRETRVP